MKTFAKLASALQADRHDGECAYDILSDGSLITKLVNTGSWIVLTVFTPAGRYAERRFRPNRQVKVQSPTHTSESAWRAMHRYDDHEGEGGGAESAYGCTYCH